MKFAISYGTPSFGADPDRMIAYAQHAERCGFEALYMPEHVVLYRGAKLGEMEFPPDLPYVDPLDALAFVAASTSRILLGTGVALIPYQHPVVLAKRLATIDVLSKGRMRLFTIGLGSLPGEAAALGIDYPSRGRRADEAIDVLRLLWSGDDKGVSHRGEFFAFDDLVSYPHPVGDTMPIHVAGSSRAAARRAGARGDGFFPGGMLSPDERVAQLALARSSAAAAGRDPDALEYTRWAGITMSPARAEALAAEGVTRVVVSATSDDPAEQQDQMSAFAERFSLGQAS
ncbi:TIGR03619 family F420-dependent LLM class oxidoreductase [Actinoplanes bogorensis]|uniref:TIGR03619 family F420-dependent LLM class oxidoreductase n=1 Tax=Paractinoplanes bogorensis TaxID=1610840 RepID=A0ABS5Z0J4_9ACTN|nr:TIGR03619 family F420-dependent LLM class oxidoreductase [Actinoplanes bogorensis]MBU2668871.1 TIGR03619 family F420-dependent LLM class oxidoreductase [Actinoplanes bogorensis]